jgi:ABC-type thiamin/hydroxymethylpyrimidine transport system permease subunit
MFLLRQSGRATVVAVAVSLWFLVQLWREGELYGKSGTIFCVWFVAAVVTQLFAPNVGVWILGLVAQVALAIVLALKQRLSEY